MSEVRYVVHPLYRWLIGGCLLLALLLVWELRRGFVLETAFFVCIALGVALWSLLAASSQITVMANSLCLATPLRPTHCVNFRQLFGVSQEGRLLPVLVLLYYPTLSSGLFDLTDARTLRLPLLLAQAELLAHLQTRLPP
jgi:hypothetical protein